MRAAVNRFKLIGLLMVVLVIGTPLSAHEGHKAIATKGVKFGPKTSSLLMEPLARKAIGLSTAKVDFGTIEESFSVPARVTLPSTRQAHATTRIAGIIEKIRVKPGDLVRAGDVLAEFRSLELESLQLELTQRIIEKALSEENLRRAKDLGERVIAGKEVLELETEVQDKENDIRTLRQKLEIVGLSTEQIAKLVEKGETTRLVSIAAPITGHVVHVDTNLGSHVEPDRHLLEVHDLSGIWVEGEVPESRISSVSQAREVRMTFSAWPGRVYKGKVEHLGAEVVEASRSVKVWASVENDDLSLKPEQFGLMLIVAGVSENAVVAPLSAIVEDGAEKYAIVQEKENAHVLVNAKDGVEEYSQEPKAGYVSVNAYVKRNVVVGRTDGQRVEIVEGLYPGDTVVTQGSHELSALYVQGTLKLSEEAKKNIGLATEEIDFREVGEVVRLNTVLRLPVGRLAFASSQIQGKVLQIHVVPGQEVKEGDVLAEIHSLEAENLELEYRRSALREKLLRTLLEQTQPLSTSGLFPRKDLLKLQADQRAQQNTILSLRARLKLLGLTESQLGMLADKGDTVRALPLSAPIAGRVADIDVVIGQVIKPGDHLFKVTDSRVLWAEAKVFEDDFNKVLRGVPEKETAIHLVGLAGLEWKIRLAFSAPSLGYEEKILPVYSEIPNDHGSLLPGMVGEMVVVVGRPEAKVIAAPNHALYSAGGQAYAFVATGNTFKKVLVQTGRLDGTYTEVIKGLFPGDKVAVTGVNELNTAIVSLK